MYQCRIIVVPMSQEIVDLDGLKDSAEAPIREAVALALPCTLARPGREKPPILSPGKTDRKRGICISFTPELRERLAARAKKRGQSMSGVVNQAVTESLERWERRERRESLEG